MILIVLTQKDCGFSLTGVVATQTLYYFQSYPDDKPSTKLIVSLILIARHPTYPMIGICHLASPWKKPPWCLHLNGLCRLLDFLHTIVIFATDWVWLVDHFGDFGIIDRIPWYVRSHLAYNHLLIFFSFGWDTSGH